jgi:branched-chain amino acid transport system ATP-binding protein
MTDAAAILEVAGLSKNFKGLAAVVDYQLRIAPGEIVGLIGPNGAGKTTVFNLLTGLYPPSAGTIRLAGRDLTRQRPDRIVRQGLARTFQNIRLFGELTVLQNILVAVQLRKKYAIADVLFSTGAFRREEARLRERAAAYLEVLGILDYRDQTAGNLPYGIQRKLEIARALATEPRVLLLDEPAAGMNRQESTELTQCIQAIRDRFGLAVILIEHDMHVVMNLCERLQVLSYGKIIAEDRPERIKDNPLVIEAYLGRSKGSA